VERPRRLCVLRLLVICFCLLCFLLVYSPWWLQWYTD
jgi:hypothetical protein